MVLVAVFAIAPLQPSILIQGGTVYDGSGGPGRIADVRVQGDAIVAVGRLRRLPSDQVIEAKGLAVSPGFIDAHTHADEGIKKYPDAESQVRQGITTCVVGQDGIWS